MNVKEMNELFILQAKEIHEDLQERMSEKLQNDLKTSRIYTLPQHLTNTNIKNRITMLRNLLNRMHKELK